MDNDQLRALADILRHQYPVRRRHFPSVKALVASGIADDTLQATVAGLLWRSDWAERECVLLEACYATPVLSFLHATRVWLKANKDEPFGLEIRRVALSELFRFDGPQSLYTLRREKRYGDGVYVSTDKLFARFLTTPCSASHFASTLIFRVGKTGPTIGRVCDLPEMRRSTS